MEEFNFDSILDEIEELYTTNEIEYNKYIKTRQIVPYEYNNILLTALYCYTTLCNILLLSKNNI